MTDGRGIPIANGGDGYNQIFVNERTFAWIDSFRTLLIRFDTLDESWLNWHSLAFALILLKV